MCLTGCSKPPTFPCNPDGSGSASSTSTSCPSPDHITGKAGTQDPKITTVSGPKDTGCGGSDWKVWFDLPQPAADDGWVIQEITVTYDVKNADGSTNLKETTHYWEAWEVKKGKKATVWQDQKKDDNDDRYYDPSRPNTKGTETVVGTAKFYPGPLPPDFKTNNPDTQAGILHATTKKPDFWDGTGTRHDLTVVWDCTGGKNTSSVSGMAGDRKVP